MYKGGSVADFFGGFSVTRRLAMLRRRVTENPPKKSATERPLIHVCRFVSNLGTLTALQYILLMIAIKNSIKKM